MHPGLMFIVVHDAWRMHPLAWIHRSEARRIACELRRSGHAVRRCAFERPPYTFVRKYALRPRIVPVAQERLAAGVHLEALRIAATLGVDWAARIDFIHEPGTDMLYFLECDVVPLVGPGSAFDRSLGAGGAASS